MLWYDENKHLTKHVLKLGYYIVRDGIENVILETEKKKQCDIEEKLRYEIKNECENVLQKEFQMKLMEKERVVASELYKYKALYEDMKRRSEDDKGYSRIISDLEKEICILKNNNYVKGNIGESIIMEALRNIYSSHLIEDTSKQSHVGDIHITNLKDNSIIMIESKYKQTITNNDVEKFYSDIEHLHEINKNISCAIFVSILSKNIPGVGEFNIEFKNEIPIIFMGFQSESEFESWFPVYIKFANKLLLCKKTVESKTEDFFDVIKPILSQIKSLKTIVGKLRNTQMMQVNASITSIDNTIRDLFDSLNTLVMNESKNQLVSDCICSKCNRTFKSERGLKIHEKKCNS